MSDATFTVLVSGGVLASQAHASALDFVSSVMRQGGQIGCVFFYGDAAEVANNMRIPLSDEFDATAQWQALHKEFGLNLYVCIASAERRGVIGADSANDHRLNTQNLANGFSVVGLAEFHSALLSTDRFVHYN